ncbi:MAG: methyltransferase domain-containing protein [Deltaproteobacteria bacterium]|nr:methyltransferase domain-containing protein [Deltaproteobacteria bacterium]MBW2159668.1 methyltransferase domain-containing protein [Deltaproteobacteria bacterium]MBW2586301.1 methyltransferase domain-containing protein [Deltaproteobacteria bacterium]
MSKHEYLMESGDEATRLENKTVEAQTVQHMELVGLREGMTVLDAGAGTGAVARTMARLVGATGSVVALDQSEERLRHGRALAKGIENLSFVQGDLKNVALPSNQFDMVWSRFVFEYLKQPELVLKQLGELAKPNGRVVVGDLDGNGLFHFPISAQMSQQLEALQSVLEGVFDPLVGRKLYTLFRRSGFTDIRTHVLPYHVYAGEANREGLENWEQKFATIRTVAMGAFPSERAYDHFVQEFMGMLRDPDVFTYSILIIVEGTPPK